MIKISIPVNAPHIVEEIPGKLIAYKILIVESKRKTSTGST